MSTAQFNLVPGGLDINGIVGDDFVLLFDFNIDLTGYSFESKFILQNAPGNLYQPFTVSNTNLPLGRVTISLTDTQTRNIGAITNTKWFFIWTIGGGTRTVLSGRFSLNPPWAAGELAPTVETVTVSVENTTVDVTVIGGAGGVVVWGDIAGTITNQTDLIAYLVANYQPLSTSLHLTTAPTGISDFTMFPGSVIPTSGSYLAMDINNIWSLIAPLDTTWQKSARSN